MREDICASVCTPRERGTIEPGKPLNDNKQFIPQAHCAGTCSFRCNFDGVCSCLCVSVCVYMAISGVLVFSLNMYVVTFAVIDPHQLTRGAIGEDHCDLCLVYGISCHCFRTLKYAVKAENISVRDVTHP